MKVSSSLLIGGGLLLGLTGVTLYDAPSAFALACGTIQCSVDSTVKGESNWISTVGSGGALTQTPGNKASNNVYSYKSCDTWLPVNGGQSTGSYPAKSSSSYDCHFSDGGLYASGQGKLLFVCPPRSDRASNGRVNVSFLDPTTKITTYKYYFCLYPQDAYAPIEREVGAGKIYTGGEAFFFNVDAVVAYASLYGSTGAVTDTTGYIDRGVDLNNPEAFVGVWQPSFAAKTGVKANGDPKYGYHRLQWLLDYRMCKKFAYPSWLNMPARYDCSQLGQDKVAAPYTYACNINPALQSGIIGGAKFTPSECDTSWKCVITGNTTLNGIPSDLSVMRNGVQIDVGFPTPTVVGGAVRNPRSWQDKSTVNQGSSPTLPYVKSTWAWNTWRPYKQKGTIAFNWVSNDAQHPFSWNDKYRFTADFNLPTQSALGQPTVYKWVLGNSECPQTTQSPKARVVRSTSG